MKQGLKLFLAGAGAGIILASGTNFASSMKDTVQRTFRDIRITMNGQAVTPKDATGKIVEPFIIDGTTYLPVRAVSNALGAKVDWDGSTRKITATKDGYTMELQIDNHVMIFVFADFSFWRKTRL